MYMMTRTSYF